MPDTEAEPGGTPIAPVFRALLALEVLFGIASLATIGLYPDQTATKFAWEIKSLAMAGVLGGLYVATTPVLILALVARRWEMIRVLIPTFIAFTTVELGATVLHWDTFFVGTPRFDIWLASYVLPPPLLLAMYLYHERRSSRPPVQRPLPQALRRTLLVLGALLTVEATIAFITPAWLSASFPWELTPLTTRVLAGWVIAIGVLLISIARENDRDRVRIASPILILILPAVGLQIVRFSDQVDTAHPRLWLNLVFFALLAGCGMYLARGGWRQTLR